MTEQEAIEVINKALEESEKIIVELTNVKELCERQQKVGDYYSNLENCVKEIDSCKVAIKALEEIQQYREIGTPEECRAAVEKQKAKKPTLIDYKKYMDVVENAKFLRGAYWCPNCNHVVKSGDFCNDCGQKLDWSDGE